MLIPTFCVLLFKMVSIMLPLASRLCLSDKCCWSLGLDLLLDSCNSTCGELLCETLSTFCAFSHDFYNFCSLV